MSNTFNSTELMQVYQMYPQKCREKLLKIRSLIYEVAKSNNHILNIKEELKWGQPSYSTVPKSVGTPIRLSWSKKLPNQYGLYIHCQTNLIEQYKSIFGNQLNYDGKRGLIFSLKENLPVEHLKTCIEMALNYHFNKKG